MKKFGATELVGEIGHIWATWLVGELYLEMHTRAISLAVSVSYWKLRMFSFDHIENLSK